MVKVVIVVVVIGVVMVGMVIIAVGNSLISTRSRIILLKKLRNPPELKRRC